MEEMLVGAAILLVGVIVGHAITRVSMEGPGR
jgi:hypothetical protein